MEVWYIRIGWPPCGIEPRLGSALDAVEIRPPNGGRIENVGQETHRDCQFRGPDMAFRIEVRGMTKATFEIAAASRKDVEVDP